MPEAHLVSERCQPVIMDFGLGMYTVQEMGQTDICTLLLLLLRYWRNVVTLLLVAIQNIFYLVCRKPPLLNINGLIGINLF